MQVQKKSRSFNFLLEILISSLFFAFCSIMCVELFIFAKNNNEYAQDLTMATMIMQSYVEEIRADNQIMIDDAIGQKEVIAYDDRYNVVIDVVNIIDNEVTYKIEVVNSIDKSIITSIETNVYRGGQDG